MAGYLFTMDSVESMRECIGSGVYSTKMSPPTDGTFRTHHEGTFADYATMQEGDNVYFFIKRKIYGIGRLVNVGGDCKYWNHPSAADPLMTRLPGAQGDLVALEVAPDFNQRLFCLFEPTPHFFTRGVDMDDVLTSNPAAFRMLRVLWKLSFIKFDDEENEAFRSIILQRNEDSLNPNQEQLTSYFPFEPVHQSILVRLGEMVSFESGVRRVLDSCADGQALRHEMAIELGLLNQLTTHDEDTIRTFGEWDYLSHQVVASPFKPVDYMDKMDVFGFRYVRGFRPTKSKYLVGEIKKGGASSDDVDQVMKYVDWVKDEYTFGDYSKIHAFLIASDFSDEVLEHVHRVGKRFYTVGMRPAESHEWDRLRLVSYSYNPGLQRLQFDVSE